MSAGDIMSLEAIRIYTSNYAKDLFSCRTVRGEGEANPGATTAVSE